MCSVRAGLHEHRHRGSPGGVLQRIGEQVGEGAAELVAGDRHLHRLRRHLEADVALPGLAVEHAHQLLHQGVDPGGLAARRALAQKPVEVLLHPLSGDPGLARHLPGPVRHVVRLAQVLGGEHHGAQQVSHVVGDLPALAGALLGGIEALGVGHGHRCDPRDAPGEPRDPLQLVLRDPLGVAVDHPKGLGPLQHRSADHRAKAHGDDGRRACRAIAIEVVADHRQTGAERALDDGGGWAARAFSLAAQGRRDVAAPIRLPEDDEGPIDVEELHGGVAYLIEEPLQVTSPGGGAGQVDEAEHRLLSQGRGDPLSGLREAVEGVAVGHLPHALGDPGAGVG